MFNLTFEELTIIGLSLAVIEILGIVCAIHSILNSRTSQGAIAWAVSLITVPVITLPLYAFFGRHKFDEYQRSLRERNISLQRELKPYHSHWVACSDDAVGNNPFVRTMKHLSGQEFTKGNSIDLLVNGENTFQAIFDAIDNAREYVLIEFFIIKDDALGNDLKQRLIDCQNRGVQVYFLYDSIGSYSLSRGYLDSLKDVGVAVSAFGSPHRFKNRYQLNFRNHRKIVIVDGLVGFAGGHNVGEEYLGRKKRYGFWRDTHIRLSGPAVMSLQEVFLYRFKNQGTVWYGPVTVERADAASEGKDVTTMVRGDYPVLTPSLHMFHYADDLPPATAPRVRVQLLVPAG